MCSSAFVNEVTPLLFDQTLFSCPPPPPAALKDPCTDVACSYGSTCIQSSDGLSAKCMCPLSCEGKREQTVCGSDGEDYRNECLLHRHACKNQKNIRVQYPGSCGEFPSPLLSFAFFPSLGLLPLAFVVWSCSRASANSHLSFLLPRLTQVLLPCHCCFL